MKQIVFFYIYNNRTAYCLFVRCEIQGKSETLECLVAGGTLTAQLINHLDAAGSIGHTCSPSTCIEVIIFFFIYKPINLCVTLFCTATSNFPTCFL